MIGFYYTVDDGEDVFYQPAQREVDGALAKIIAERFFFDYVPDFLQKRMVEQCKAFLSDLSNSACKELEDDYHDDLEEYFRPIAKEQYRKFAKGVY